MSAITLLSVLAACTSVPAPAPVSRDIGDPPPDCVETLEPKARAKKNMYVHNRELTLALRKANQTIVKSCREPWQKARQQFLAGEAPK